MNTPLTDALVDREGNRTGWQGEWDSKAAVAFIEHAGRMEKDRAKLKKALEFYADATLYEGPVSGSYNGSGAEIDAGFEARTILAQTEDK